jgi:hypothetical protein
MTLTVEPEALRAFARQLSNCTDAVHAARSYSIEQGDIPAPEAGLLTGHASFDSLENQLRPAHEQFSSEIAATLAYLADLLERSERALNGTATWYEETDRRTASQLDGAYPQVARPSADPEG